jgi:hypothetical protein
LQYRTQMLPRSRLRRPREHSSAAFVVGIPRVETRSNRWRSTRTKTVSRAELAGIYTAIGSFAGLLGLGFRHVAESVAGSLLAARLARAHQELSLWVERIVFDGILRIAPQRLYILQADPGTCSADFMTTTRRIRKGRNQFGPTPATHLGSSGPPSIKRRM